MEYMLSSVEVLFKQWLIKWLCRVLELHWLQLAQQEFPSKSWTTAKSHWTRAWHSLV
jgi:hypothetical protein